MDISGLSASTMRLLARTRILASIIHRDVKITKLRCIAAWRKSSTEAWEQAQGADKEELDEEELRLQRERELHQATEALEATSAGEMAATYLYHSTLATYLEGLQMAKEPLDEEFFRRKISVLRCVGLCLTLPQGTDFKMMRGINTWRVKIARENESLMQAELFSTLHSAMLQEQAQRTSRAAEIIRDFARFELLRIDAARLVGLLSEWRRRILDYRGRKAPHARYLIAGALRSYLFSKEKGMLSRLVWCWRSACFENENAIEAKMRCLRGIQRMRHALPQP